VYFLQVFLTKPKRIIFFTATAIAHNPTLIRGTVGCIFRFFLLIIAYEHNIVIRQALKDKVIRDTVIDDFKIYSSPEKILCNHSVGSTFFREKKWFIFLFWLWLFIDRSLNRCVSNNGFHRFKEAVTFDLNQIIQSTPATDTSRPPYPFPV